MTRPKKVLEYKIIVSKKNKVTFSSTSKDRGAAYKSLMFNAALTLHQATETLDTCDAKGSAGCSNIRGEAVRVVKE